MAERRPCFIGLGANLGDPPVQLRWAIEQFKRRLQPTQLKVSPLYRSAPLGPPGQPDYCNAVCELHIDCQPAPLLAVLKAIEADAGRLPGGQRWGARLLDLDILMMGALQLDLPQLRIPHPQIGNRNFVLAPLLDLDGELEIPGLGRARSCLERVGRAGLSAWTEGA